MKAIDLLRRRGWRSAPNGLTPEEKKLIKWALWVAKNEHNLDAKTRAEIRLIERKLS